MDVLSDHTVIPVGKPDRPVMPGGTPTRMSPDHSQHEPVMHVPRPSSDRSQDVSHILVGLFHELYTKEVMSKETVKNLTLSSDGSTKFHKKCMTELHQAHLDHKKKLEEYNTVEREIMQARARAVSADERALNKLSSDVGSETYDKLGLPPVPSHFRWCLEESALKKHKLLVPSELFLTQRQLGDGPRRRKTPHFSLPTVSSSLHILTEPQDDGYTDLELTKDILLEEDEEKSMMTLSSDSAELTSIPPQHRIRSEKKKSRKDKWRENMKHEARIEDRSLLARLEERHNFLKNPRFLPLDGGSGGKLLTKMTAKQAVLKAGREVTREIPCADSVQVFASNPEVVEFREWIVGRVYEVNLELRNVSTVSRQLRVLPPKSAHFSLGLGKFPGKQGIVAPGMCAQYSVRFMPDALADVHDELEVLSQSEQPLVVKIKAQRTPPVLIVPEAINCGFCLVGGVKVVDLPLKNVGGNGRFCIMKRTSWPAANFKTVVNPSCLDLGLFQIRPSVFEVLAGQVATLEILFSPHEDTSFKEELVIVCDNCQVKYVTIEGHGETAAVELVSVSNSEDEDVVLGEMADITADHLVRFPPLNPHSYFMKQIIVHNSTNVEMPYSWHILKPNLSSGLESLSPRKSIDLEKFDFYPDPESCFYIEPRSGMFLPNAIHEFVLTFAPHKVGNYNNVLHLVLSDVPESKRGSDSFEDVKPSLKRLASDSAVEETGTRSAKSGRSIQLKQSSSSMPSLHEVIALEIETKASCIPYSVVLHPPAVVVPGAILVGTTVRRPLQMANYSLAPVNFKWDSVTTPNIVEVEPAIGTINPGEVAELEVTATGLNTGPLSCNVLCNIQHQTDPVSVAVSALIKGPNVVIDNVSVDFGLVKVGSTAMQKVYIRNTTQLNASWKLHKPQSNSGSFQISPCFGELPSLETCEILVTFRPVTQTSLNTTINLEVEGGVNSSVGVKAEAQNLQICFEECILVVKDTFLSVPKVSTVVLINQTLFPTKFRFGDLKGAQSDFCDVTVYPNKGTLGPREKLDLQVTFQSNKVEEITQIFLPCYIEEVVHPVVLGFYSNVSDLAVSYATPCAEGDDLKLDFGDIEVSTIRTSQVILTNLTAIRAPWTACVENFAYHPSTPHPPPQNFKSMRSRRAMLGRTPNLADPLAKTASQAVADKSKLILNGGKGAVFLINPPNGILAPYQSQVIDVSAYNDMWGRYKDTLVCKVEGLEAQMIPIDLNVTGCPLKFQIANHNNMGTVLRYGTHLDGSAPVARKVRINNTSSSDVRVDWQTCNYPEPTDTKLIDLNIWFGEAFPLKQENASQNLKSKSAESSDKFVRVRIEPHNGKKSNLPFHVEPDQVNIPALENRTVSVIFQPMIGEENVKEREWKSFALGFMTIDRNQAINQNKNVIRNDKYEIPPLRLEMTSFVRMGILSVEASDEDDEFILALHKILDERENQVQLKSVSLANFTETPLSFSLSLQPPFFFRSTVTSQESQHLARNVLNPQSNIKVQVGFGISEATRQDLRSIRDGNLLPNCDIITDDLTGNSKLLYKDEVRIRYSNGVVQTFPLVANVPLPTFNLSHDSVDFGVCFVGQERHCYVTISNPSYADSHWCVEAIDPVDSTQCEIAIEPSFGVLEAYDNFTSKNKMTLTIRFIARNEANYDTTFVFKGKLGEETRQLKISATSSYDGQFERKL